MATASTRLADLREQNRFVRCRCDDCGRDLGRYAFWRLLLDSTDQSWLPVLTEDYRRRVSWASRPGTGLGAENWDGTPYVRLRCKCGRNQKFGLSTLRASPVELERGERVVRL